MLKQEKIPINTVEEACFKCGHLLAGHSERNGKFICHYTDNELLQCGCVL